MTTFDSNQMDENDPENEQDEIFQETDHLTLSQNPKLPNLPKIAIFKSNHLNQNIGLPNFHHHLNQKNHQKRKFSIPSALHSNLHHLKVEEPPGFNTKRRFSNVSDVVSRKLSTTIIGSWRTPSIPPEEIIGQGRVLCGQYIRNRLKRSGIFSKKLGLYRIRSMVGTSSAGIVREVFPALVFAGLELESMHPKLFSNVSRQASATPGGVLISDKAAGTLLTAIAHDLFKNGDITWGKIVAIFAVSGGLAVDCVCQGHPEYLHALMDAMEEVLEDCLADWIAANGGWVALSNQCRTEDEDFSIFEGTTIVLKGMGSLLVAYLIIQFCWKIVFFWPEKESLNRNEL
ncbi:uncharacterized protein [Onthophagus taurus]|uniref:uncharacterized protein n=1 Tax=Onthophagus taurus TaxID=166361 RepID=UPI0039BE7970